MALVWSASNALVPVLSQLRQVDQAFGSVEKEQVQGYSSAPWAVIWW